MTKQEQLALAKKLDDSDFLIVRNCPMVSKFDHENVDEYLTGDEHNLIVTSLRALATADPASAVTKYES